MEPFLVGRKDVNKQHLRKKKKIKNKLQGESPPPTTPPSHLRVFNTSNGLQQIIYIPLFLSFLSLVFRSVFFSMYLNGHPWPSGIELTATIKDKAVIIYQLYKSRTEYIHVSLMYRGAIHKSTTRRTLNVPSFEFLCLSLFQSVLYLQESTDTYWLSGLASCLLVFRECLRFRGNVMMQPHTDVVERHCQDKAPGLC